MKANAQAATNFSQVVDVDAVNQLSDRARLLNPKFDVVEKLLVEPCNTLSLGHTAYK